MRRLQVLVPFLLGFLLATLAGLVLRADPVMAQQAWSDLGISRPLATRPAQSGPRLRGAASDEALAPSIVPPDNDAGRLDPPPTAAGAGHPPGGQDGDAESAMADEPAADGTIAAGDMRVDADGRDTAGDGARSVENRGALPAAWAGYDALAFQIELEPGTDARPGRLARFEPFAPVGRRAGSWVVFTTVEAGVSGTTNVSRTPTAKPDLIFDARPTLVAVTDWQRHAVQFTATGLGSAYGAFPSENDRSYSLEARGRVDVTRFAKIEVLAAYSYEQEARSSTFALADARSRTPYVTDKVAISFTQRFNALTVQLRGGVTEIDYRPVATYAGTVLSNDERDVSQRDIAVRAAWNFNSALAVFAELAGNGQTYRTVPGDGISRDSTGDRIRAGLAFGSTSQIWRGEIAAGYGHQHLKDARLADVEGPLLDANLAWRPTLITSVLLNARSDFLTSTTPGQGGVLQRTAGLELRHAFQRRINAVAALGYQVAQYEGLALTERTITGDLGVEYYLAQDTTLLAKYQHMVLASTAEGAGATADMLRLGVRWRPQ